MDIISKARRIGIKGSVLPYLSLLVKEERLKLGLKQTELAMNVGIGLKTLRKIEQGDLNVNFNKLNYLLNCLGLYLRPSDLVTSPVDKAQKLFSKEYILDILKNIYPIFKIKYGVKELALFGSYAKDVAEVNSDIDILIEFENTPSLEIEGEIQLILENLYQGKKVDLSFKENLHSSFVKEIEETRINVSKK